MFFISCTSAFSRIEVVEEKNNLPNHSYGGLVYDKKIKIPARTENSWIAKIESALRVWMIKLDFACLGPQVPWLLQRQ